MNHDSKGRLRIVGGGDEPFAVSFALLSRILDGLQQAAYAVAAAELRLSVNLRFRPSAEFKDAYALLCEPAVSGSYVVPMHSRDMANTFEEFGALSSHEYIAKLSRALYATAHENIDELRDFLPDSVLRNRFLRDVKRTLPSSGDSWHYEFASGNRVAAIFSSDLRPRIELWLQATDRERTMTVIGDLAKIDFQDHILTLVYQPTGREIHCSYVPELEESLLETRHEPLSVTGEYTLDANSHPVRLSNVTSIEPVDLSQIQISEFAVGEKEISFATPLLFYPQLEDMQQTLVAVDDSIGLRAYAQSRTELVHEIYGHLAMLWQEYVETTDELTVDAKNVGRALRDRTRTRT